MYYMLLSVELKTMNEDFFCVVDQETEISMPYK